MKNSKSQGSALIIVLVILGVALIAVLGFIFWQNFLHKPADTAVVSSADEKTQADPYKGWNEFKSLDGKYTLKYPKDWEALKEVGQNAMYIRNFDPASKPTEGRYPDGYINLQVYHEENDASFKAKTGYTTTEWYEMLGKSQLHSGPATYAPEFVKDMKISGLPAKSAKAAADEVDEVVYVLRGDVLYSIYLYPYGISSNPTVKLMLDSFTFTY